MATIDRFIGFPMRLCIDGVDISLSYPIFSHQLQHQVCGTNKEIDLSFLHFITQLGFEWSVEERRAILNKVHFSHKRHSSSLHNQIDSSILMYINKRSFIDTKESEEFSKHLLSKFISLLPNLMDNLKVLNNEIAWLYSKFTFSTSSSGNFTLQPVSMATSNLSSFRAFVLFSRAFAGPNELEYAGLLNEDVMPFLQPLENFNGRPQSAPKPSLDQLIVPFWLLYKPLGPADLSTALGSRKNPLSYSSASTPSAVVEEVRSPEEISALARNSPIACMERYKNLMIRRLDILLQIHDLEKMSIQIIHKKMEDVCLRTRSKNQLSACASEFCILPDSATVTPPLPPIVNNKQTTSAPSSLAIASHTDQTCPKIIQLAPIAQSHAPQMMSTTTSRTATQFEQSLPEIKLRPQFSVLSTSSQPASYPNPSATSLTEYKVEPPAKLDHSPMVPSTTSSLSSIPSNPTLETATSLCNPQIVESSKSLSLTPSNASSASDLNPPECSSDRNRSHLPCSSAISTSLPSTVLAATSNLFHATGGNLPTSDSSTASIISLSSNPSPDPIQLNRNPLKMLRSTTITSTDSISSIASNPPKFMSSAEKPSTTDSLSSVGSDRAQSAAIRSDRPLNPPQADRSTATPLPGSFGLLASTSQPIFPPPTLSERNPSNVERIATTVPLAISSSRLSPTGSNHTRPPATDHELQTLPTSSYPLATATESARPPQASTKASDEDRGIVGAAGNPKSDHTFDFTGNPTFNFFAGNTTTLPHLDTTYFSHSLQLPNTSSLLTRPLSDLPAVPLAPPPSLESRDAKPLVEPVPTQVAMTPLQKCGPNFEPMAPVVVPRSQNEPQRTVSKPLEQSATLESQFAAPFAKTPLAQASFLPLVPCTDKQDLEPKMKQPIGKGLLCADFEDDDGDDGDDTTRNFSFSRKQEVCIRENVPPPTTPFGFQPIRNLPIKNAPPVDPKASLVPATQSLAGSYGIDAQRKAPPTGQPYERYAALQADSFKADPNNRRSIDPLNYSIAEPVGSSTAFLGSLIQNRTATNQIASGDTCLLKTLGLLSDAAPTTKNLEENTGLNAITCSSSSKPKPLPDPGVCQLPRVAPSASRQSSSGTASEMHASLESLSLGSSANTSNYPSSTARPARNDEARTKRVSILPQLTTVPEELSSASGSGATASSASASLSVGWSRCSPRDSTVPQSDLVPPTSAFVRSTLPPGQQQRGELTVSTPGSASIDPSSRSSLLNSHSAI